jgi:hypothetical protein
MTAMMIPVRDSVCRAATDALPRHRPAPGTVETENSAEIEWQFGECTQCGGSISRFRLLLGGLWFDQWGELTEYFGEVSA